MAESHLTLCLSIVSKEFKLLETIIAFPEGESLETLRLLAFSQLDNDSLIEYSDSFFLLDSLGRPLKEVDEVMKSTKLAIEGNIDAKFWLVYSSIAQCSFQLFEDETIQPFGRMIDTTFSLCNICKGFLDPSLLAINNFAVLQESKCQSAELIVMGILPPLPNNSTFESNIGRLLPGSPAWLFYKRQLLHLSLQAQLAQSNLQSNNEAIANFQRRLHSGIATVMAYEDPAEQAKVRQEIDFACILRYFREEERKQSDILPYPEDLLMTALMRWFKCDFFSWCNKPACSNPHCEGGNMTNEGMSPPTPFEQNEGGAGRVETYRCSACQTITRFPRYNNPSFMCRNSRRGRCGEWANTFGMICRCLGLDTRYVLDFTDHVWVEVWSPGRGRFVHADPCERAWDAPLLYEAGWNKQLTHVLCFGRYGVVDGIARYSRQLQRVLLRRASSQLEQPQSSPPEAIIQQIITARNDEVYRRYVHSPYHAQGGNGGLEITEIITRLSRGAIAFTKIPDITPAEAQKRRALDQWELEGSAFLLPAQKDQLKESEKVGRISGDIAWRKQRGEIEGDGDNARVDGKEGSSEDKLLILLPEGLIFPLLPQSGGAVCFEVESVSTASSSLRVNGLPLLLDKGNRVNGKSELRLFVFQCLNTATGLSFSHASILKLDTPQEERTTILNRILTDSNNGNIVLLQYVPSNKQEVESKEQLWLVQALQALSHLEPFDISTITSGKAFLCIVVNGKMAVLLAEDQLTLMARKGEENRATLHIQPTAIKLWLRLASSRSLSAPLTSGNNDCNIEYRKLHSQFQHEPTITMAIKRNLLDIRTFLATEQDHLQQAINHAEELVQRGFACVGFSICEQASGSKILLFFGQDEPFPHRGDIDSETDASIVTARLNSEVVNDKLEIINTFLRCYLASSKSMTSSAHAAASVEVEEEAKVRVDYVGWSGCYELGGGHHGDTMPFDALQHIPNSAWPSVTLAKVDLWAGTNLVNGVQVAHNVECDDERRVVNSSLFSSTNDDPTCRSLTLSGTNEKIQQVEVRAGALIDGITLITTAGRSLKAGGSGGEKLIVNIKTEEGQEVIGFVGGTGGHLHHLSVMLMHKKHHILMSAQTVSPPPPTKTVEEQELQAILERHDLYLSTSASNLVGFFNPVDINEETRADRHSGYWRQNDFEKLRSLLLLLLRQRKNRGAAIIALQSVIAYLQNIHKAPEQEKYQRIKLTNTVLVNKVLPIKGALSLLCYGPAAFELKLDEEENVLASRMKAVYSRPPDRVTNKAIVRWLGKYLDVLRDVLVFMTQSS